MTSSARPFLDAADHQLTEHGWHPAVAHDRYEYIG
jgi:hypothetical protein